MPVITQKAFVDALIRAGFVSANDIKTISKITITVDAKGHATGAPVLVDIERIGDHTLTTALSEFERG